MCVFGLGVQNEAGQRLTEFCQENALVIANISFQQRKKRSYMWTSPDWWNQIDYILCSWRWRSSAATKSLQSCPTRCDPIDGSPPGSPVPGILQARILEWVAISFSNAWKWKVKVKSAQSCLTPSDPMDCSLPGSSIHGMFQARVLEWGAIAFSLMRVGCSQFQNTFSSGNNVLNDDTHSK